MTQTLTMSVADPFNPEGQLVFARSPHGVAVWGRKLRVKPTRGVSARHIHNGGHLPTDGLASLHGFLVEYVADTETVADDRTHRAAFLERIGALERGPVFTWHDTHLLPRVAMPPGGHAELVFGGVVGGFAGFFAHLLPLIEEWEEPDWDNPVLPVLGAPAATAKWLGRYLGNACRLPS